MEYQIIIDMLENSQNQPTKFWTKNWVEKNDESRGTYNTDRHIKFKTLMLRSRSCDCSVAYTLLSGTIAITRAGNDDAVRQLDEKNKGIIFKNCVPFTDCVSEINNTQVDNAKYMDVVMQMYNLIEYSDNYSKMFTWAYNFKINKIKRSFIIY